MQVKVPRVWKEEGRAVGNREGCTVWSWKWTVTGMPLTPLLLNIPM